jgi:hypothetical protein
MGWFNRAKSSKASSNVGMPTAGWYPDAGGVREDALLGRHRLD